MTIYKHKFILPATITDKLEQHNQLNQNCYIGNISSNQQCKLLSDVKDEFIRLYINENTKEYKQAVKILTASYGIKQQKFKYDVRIGAFLKQQNSDDLMNLPKSDIEKLRKKQKGNTGNQSPRTKNPKSDYLHIISEKDQEIVSLKERVHYLEEQLKQEQANNDIIVEHVDNQQETINDKQELISDYRIIASHYREMVENRGGNWYETIKNIGVKNIKRL
jgi:hypothetical protein